MSKTKKVLIAGMGAVVNTMLDAQSDRGMAVVIIDKDIPEERPAIEIGGKRFLQIKHRGLPEKEIMSKAMTEYREHVRTRGRRRLADDINIVDEYRKIQDKTCTLSKWERNEVGLLFTLNFKEA